MAVREAGPAADLAADRARLVRLSTAERVADILRDRIIEGYFAPGERLAEETIGAGLGVSRNTLREAFRLLCHERLAVHELNRGVFVRELSADDVVDLYSVRKLVEVAAVRSVRRAGDAQIDAIRLAVEDGQAAAARDDWRDVGTADLRFHLGIAGLVGSARVDELMRGLLAEMRLVFHVMGSAREFHEPYLTRNEEIYQVCVRRDGRRAATALKQYLDNAEQQLVAAYRERSRRA